MTELAPPPCPRCNDTGYDGVCAGPCCLCGRLTDPRHLIAFDADGRLAIGKAL